MGRSQSLSCSSNQNLPISFRPISPVIKLLVTTIISAKWLKGSTREWDRSTFKYVATIPFSIFFARILSYFIIFLFYLFNFFLVISPAPTEGSKGDHWNERASRIVTQNDCGWIKSASKGVSGCTEQEPGMFARWAEGLVFVHFRVFDLFVDRHALLVIQ